MSTAPQVLPADARLRNTVALASLGILLMAALGIWWLQAFLADQKELFNISPETALTNVLAVVQIIAACGAILSVVVAASLARLSVNILRARQFPPPGMKVLRETRVRTGAAAKRLAVLGLVATVLLMLLGLLGMWMVNSVATEILSPAPPPQAVKVNV